MSVPCPAFFFFEEDDHGSAQGQCARGLPQIFSGGVRQRAHLVYLRRCGHGDGRPASGAGRYGGAGGRGAGVEHFYSLGLLTGIGGSVLLSAKRGSGAAGQAEANEYFTTAVLASVLLPLNIFSTYYFQAILKPGAAFFVSVARGLVISGALILLLPAVLGPASIWWAMPVTERLVACCAAAAMRRATRALPPC